VTGTGYPPARSRRQASAGRWRSWRHTILRRCAAVAPVILGYGYGVRSLSGLTQRIRNQPRITRIWRILVV